MTFFRFLRQVWYKLTYRDMERPHPHYRQGLEVMRDRTPDIGW